MHASTARRSRRNQRGLLLELSFPDEEVSECTRDACAPQLTPIAILLNVSCVCNDLRNEQDPHTGG
jgi:hypothetical protein